MTGLAIILAVWLGLGATGAWFAHRGSMRDYGKNIYGKPLIAGTVIFGFAGFVGSSVAW